MLRPVPIGVDDFRALRERGMEYIDKSHLVREVLDKGAQALLLPRPRRFGKTLAMTMLRCFFEKRADDLAPLFADLSIWQAGDSYRAHFQRYPVIFLTLKDIKLETFDLAWDVIRKRLAGLFSEHRALLDSGGLTEEEVRRYRLGPQQPGRLHPASPGLRHWLRLHRARGRGTARPRRAA